MHRTETIDYVVVIAGEIDMDLEHDFVIGRHRCWSICCNANSRLRGAESAL
jgi:hypothetical protein